MGGKSLRRQNLVVDMWVLAIPIPIPSSPANSHLDADVDTNVSRCGPTLFSICALLVLSSIAGHGRVR